MTTPDIVGNVLLTLAAVPANCSVLVFSRVKWRLSKWGRHMMSEMVTVVLILDLGIVHIFAQHTPWFAWLRVLVYALLFVMLCWRLSILYASYREGSPNEASV
jgi:peptidoglycan/LPS O-acetylase OafA/YrhL